MMKMRLKRSCSCPVWLWDEVCGARVQMSLAKRALPAADCGDCCCSWSWSVGAATLRLIAKLYGPSVPGGYTLLQCVNDDGSCCSAVGALSSPSRWYYRVADLGR